MEAQLLPYLQQTLNPSTARNAEQALRSAECQPGFAISLLKLVASTNVEDSCRQAAALFFKNSVKRSWKGDEGNSWTVSDCMAVKTEIIGLMISLPPLLQVQLGEAVSIIADSDFPENWPDLIDTLASRLNPDDMVVSNGVLQTAHSIFKRWRSQFRSDVLFTEIKFVLDRFCKPYLDLLRLVDKLIEQNTQNAAALRVLLQTLLLLSKISFDLNCQDLPEFFEDNMTEIFGIFHKYLTFSNPLLKTDDDEEVGPIETVKASILELVNLYIMRFEEDFSMLPEFANTTWSLLTSTGLEMKYDIANKLLVSRALGVLTAVSKSTKHASLFASEDVMRQIVEKIILPNMSLRTSDEELFTDDPIEFIRRDLEGSDSDTRRRASADFIRGLMDKFENMITGIIMNYIGHYLNEFQLNPTVNWRSQDTAVYLLASIAAKGHISQYGVTSTNTLVDVVEFLDKNILASLTAPLDSIHPILKVDALKFVYTFRNQLTKDQLVSLLPFFVTHLESNNYVVYTYASICIERVLFLKRDNTFVILESDIAPQTRLLLERLFRLIERGKTTQKLAENDFLMRCVMRVIISSHDAVIPHAQLALTHLTAILTEISKNPSNPRFNHFTFESIGALIRFSTKTPPVVSQFEAILFPTFQNILVQDVTEFAPYVFQLLAQLLETHNEPGLTPQYKAFLAPFLSPSLWESKGNIPALVRLLEAYLLRGADDIIAAKQIEPLLGIFQKLLASKLHDHHGFDLLQSMFIQVPLDVLQPYVKQIFILLFTRLNASRTEKYTSNFTIFTYLLMALGKPGLGPSFVITSMDEVQPGIFGQILENFILPETQKINGAVERKTASIGLSRLLTEAEATQTGGPYAELWHQILVTLLKLFELPQEVVELGNDIEEVDPDLDFQASFAKLGTCAKLKPDLFPSIPDPKKYLAERLYQSNQSTGGKIALAIQTRLPQDAQSVLSSYGLAF